MDSQSGARSKQPLAFNSLLAPSVSSGSQLFSPSTIQVTESTNISSITDQYNAVVVIIHEINSFGVFRFPSLNV
jgi:hypothetical protein